MRFKILRRVWGLRFLPHLGFYWVGNKRKAYDGFCDPPDKPGKEIRILARLRGQQLCETLIHEMMHAAHWHLSEDAVEEMSCDMARVLCKPEVAERIWPRSK